MPHPPHCSFLLFWTILSKRLCALFCLSEAATEASESHLQLHRRQPRWADLLWGWGDRGGWRGGPGVVGQYLGRCKFSVLVCVDTLCSQIKAQSAPSPADFPLWSHFHHVEVGTLGNHGGWSKKAMTSLWLIFPLLRLLLLPLWSPFVWTSTSCNLFSSEPPLQTWPYLVTFSLRVPAWTLKVPWGPLAMLHLCPAFSGVIALLCVWNIKMKAQ